MQKAHQEHCAAEQKLAAVTNALRVCLCHLTGGLDGEYIACDPAALARDAIEKAQQ